MQDIYRNIHKYNTDRERKILRAFDDMITDMVNNKKLNSIITQLFIRGRKLNFSLVFITESYFKVSKDVRRNSTHFFIMKIPNKRELQQITLNHSSDINSKDSIKICKKCTAEPYSFLVIDDTLASYNPLRFRKIYFQYIMKSWQLIIRLKMKNYNMTLTEKLPKYHLYHQAKLVSMNVLQEKKYYHTIKNK